MPKANTIKKSKFISDEYIRNTSDSGSIDLFAAYNPVHVDDNRNDSIRSEQKTRQESKKEERHRTQSLFEKSGNDNKGSEENRDISTNKRTRHKKDVQFGLLENSTSDGEGNSDNESSETTLGGGRKVRKRKKADDGVGVKTGSGEQETKRVSRRGKREEVEGRKTVNDINPKDFKLTEFEDSDNIIGQRPIQHGPFPTDNEMEVYIILDELRYRVSACSIRDGYYVQGLDSKFLVSKYHPYKKR